MAATVTSKGQVTIPKPARDLLGIEPGSKVDFERTPDGRIFLSMSMENRGPAASHVDKTWHGHGQFFRGAGRLIARTSARVSAETRMG